MSVCVLTQVPTCINPLDYLDVQPEDIDVKQLFDEVVLSNLIDAKSRQTISNYPLLGLFYNLYLDANNCGKDISGKLTYNDLFTFKPANLVFKETGVNEYNFCESSNIKISENVRYKEFLSFIVKIFKDINDK